VATVQSDGVHSGSMRFFSDPEPVSSEISDFTPCTHAQSSLIFYIPNTLIKLIITALEFVVR